MPEIDKGKKELTITRIFDAPRELVFKAWTTPRLVTQWWSPAVFTIPVCELDVRPGGAILIHMRAPDGTILPMKGAYREVVEPERLVFTAGALEDENGDFQLESLDTVTFSEQDGKTKLTLHVEVITATPTAQGALAGMEAGWNQSLDKLVGALEKA